MERLRGEQWGFGAEGCCWGALREVCVDGEPIGGEGQGSRKKAGVIFSRAGVIFTVLYQTSSQSSAGAGVSLVTGS